jgi:hypothetical protein
VGKPKPIKIFYPGNHTDYSGRKVPVSKAALDAMVSNFNRLTGRIPLVVGHPATNDESFGYATKLAIDQSGDVSVADYEGLSPAFSAIVNEVGAKISVKLRLPGHPVNSTDGIELDHIGFFFGKQQVALDKLPTASFASDQHTSYIRIKNMDEEELQAREEAIAKREAEFAAKEAEFAAKAAVAPVVAELVASGHVPPADSATISAIFARLEGDEDFTASFSAGKESPVAALTRILKVAKVPLGESDPGGGGEGDDEELAVAHFMAPSGDLDEGSAKMDKKIRGCMAKDGLSYGAARKKVMKEMA